MIKELSLKVDDSRWEDITLIGISDERLAREIFNRGLTPDRYAEIYARLYAEQEQKTHRLEAAHGAI